MIDLNNPPIGFVGVGNKKTGISAFLQHHLVGTGTHAFIVGYPQGSRNDIPTVFESDMRVGYDLWSNYLKDTNYDMWIYQIVGVTQEEVNYALDYCIKNFLGDAYGYLEWLYFPYQTFCRKILHKDVRNQKNWLTAGVICTELWWWYIWALTGGFVFTSRWIKLRSIIDQWNPDTLTANDVLHICQDNPDIFCLQMKRENGIINQPI